MTERDTQTLEIDLLLEAIYRRYGHDFRDYARASLTRRVRRAQIELGCETVAAMIPRILHDPDSFSLMLSCLSITVTDMFRDPPMYRALREEVIPVLKTFPFIKVWHAGCATGEEAYSLAIVLKEEGVYERCTIFATDFNDNALQKAGAGVYDLERIRQFTRNYQDAGGTASFADYYQSAYGAAAISHALKKNITFANHNLAVDGVFGEMHLILCRNVLIYFSRQLQSRVINLFNDSLIRNGFLCLGSKESMMFAEAAVNFEPVNDQWRVFRKTKGNGADRILERG